MRYCKKFNVIPTTPICLACKHCLPPSKRIGSKMCKNEVTHEDKADALILYCKLLKYLRTTTVTARGMNMRINVFKKMYNDLVKDRYVPYVTRSVWKNELCFGLEYHPIYGYNMAISFNTLKDVKL